MLNIQNTLKNTPVQSSPNKTQSVARESAGANSTSFCAGEITSRQSQAIRSAALPLLSNTKGEAPRFKTTKEADKYLEEKYDIMSEFTNINQANLVVDVIEDFVKLNDDPKMFKNMQIWKLHPFYDDGRTIAQGGRYGIDLSEAYDWDNHAEFIKKNYEETAFLASPDPKEVIYHEFMHYLDENASPARYGQIRKMIDSGMEFKPAETVRATMAKVSGYAQQDPLEFIAEYGAARMCGLTFSKDVDDYYEKLGGPKIVFPKEC